MQNFWQKHKKIIIGISVSIVLMAGILFMQDAFRFMADLLQQPEPFDGTTWPVKAVPQWTQLSAAEYKMPYDSIPQEKFHSLPNYDPAIFGTTLASVNWKNDSTLANKLITFPVPYMGSYQSGSKEYSGSHLAVDIKMPSGTPVYAVANGKVVKAANGGGFGLHIVIMHPNVPLTDKNETVTLYTAYAHLSSTNVTVGQIVKRGDMIGLSGSSGTSTTPHLHFQADLDVGLNGTKVPWHPWWPFTSAEAAASGVSFFDGVTAGLGKDSAMNNTINPLLWVQRYLVADNSQTPTDFHASGATTNNSSNTEVKPANNSNETATVSPAEKKVELASTDTQTNNQIIAANNPAENIATAPKIKYEFSGDSYAMIGNAANIKITAKNENGEIINPKESVALKISGNATTPNKTLSASDFQNGVVSIFVQDNSAEKVTVSMEGSENTYEVNFIDQVKSIAKFGIEVPEKFLMYTPQKITIQSLDQDGNPTPNAALGGIVKLSTSTDIGTFSPDTLSANDFKEGKAEVELTYSNKEAFSIRAQEGSIIGESKQIYPRLFSDLESNHENYQAISYLKEHGIISGYPDGTFQPNKIVSRVEALKIIFLGLNIPTNANSNLKFSDTNSSQWYAPFLSKAVRSAMVNGYPDGTFKPAQVVNLAEYMKMLVNASGEKAPEVNQKPYNDVGIDTWFAPFAAFAKNKNIFPIAGDYFNGGEGVTRAKVAEAIYRMIALRKNFASRYSENLTVQ